MTQNPYQQNIDILKEFFRKPIILVFAILSFVNIVFQFFIGIINPYSSAVKRAAEFFVQQQQNSPANVSISNFPSVNINILAILIAVAFLLFYIFSKNKDNNLSVPSTMYKVVSIIQLVISCIVTALIIGALSLFGTMGLVLSPYQDATESTRNAGAIMSMFSVTLLAIVIPIFAFVVLSAIARLLFANSIKKSLTSIYLYRKGAMFFGILHFIVVAATVFSIFGFIILYFTQEYMFHAFSPLQIALVLVQFGLSIAIDLTAGLIAVKYSSYIKNVSQKFRVEVPAPSEVEPAPQPIINHTAPDVQPAPIINQPQGDNPYATVQTYQQPVHEEVPQAPVQTYQQPVQEGIPQAPVQQYSQPVQQEFPEAPAAESPQPKFVEQPVEQKQTEPVPQTESTTEEVPEPEPEQHNEQAEEKPAYVPRFCTACGNPVNPGDNYCNHCGAEIIYDL